MNNNELIIEDNEYISKALEVGLNARGRQVSTFFDSIMGIERSTTTQDIPMIFLTVSNQLELRQKAMPLEGEALFEKS